MADQQTCQSQAVTYSHQFYTWRSLESGGGLCLTYADCSSPITGAKNDWMIYKKTDTDDGSTATPMPTSAPEIAVPTSCKSNVKFVIKDVDGAQQYHGRCMDMYRCQWKCADIPSCKFNWWAGHGACYTFESSYVEETTNNAIASGDGACTTEHLDFKLSVNSVGCYRPSECKVGVKFVEDGHYHGRCMTMKQCQKLVNMFGGFNWSPSDGSCYTQQAPYVEKATNDIVVSGDTYCVSDLTNMDLFQSNCEGTCSSFSCPVGYLPKASASGEKCAGIQCTTASDLSTCCEEDPNSQTCPDETAKSTGYKAPFDLCPSMIEFCTDPTHGPTVRSNCPATCNVCGYCGDTNPYGTGYMTGYAPPHNDCNSAKAKLLCGTENVLVDQNCPKSCGTCIGGIVHPYE